MYDYEKKLAQMERKTPQITYEVNAYPISKIGEKTLGNSHYYEDGQIKMSFVFYYIDENETEEERLQIVASKIPQALARKRVAGLIEDGGYYTRKTLLFNLLDVGYTSPPEYGKDWNYDVKRIDHDYSNRITIGDIKALGVGNGQTAKAQ